ncbi:hypothetical protein [Sagittula stellata]|uniref:Uncharacterized protein n=1 Tax=Sagittula stellata (strain ATCC 700073 / DSM 11524 / E-37) TaxID=388399 RepID=A3K3B6_SAGS3|nr:hypothetical protein [Sagittula stellata]EBA08030.1 hypothetical protein SSE37_10819 [Sagittula stellata E-37]
MRQALFALIIAIGATPVVAQGDLEKCAQTEAWFKLAVDSRVSGRSKADVRTALRAEMERKAADQLADFVFTLPPNMLTPAVGQAAREQCERMDR